MKRSLVIITVLLAIFGVGGLIVAYFIEDKYFQGLLVGLSCSFFQLFLGLLIVNIYLDRKSRKGAIHSILVLSNYNIGKFHNRFLELLWTKFGQNELGNLIDEYIQGDGRPEIIPPEKREKIYGVIKNNHLEIVSLLTELESTFTEMSRLIGWDLDATLLQFTINARSSIREFLAITPDDSEDSKLHLVEYLIDIEYSASSANGILKDLAGIKDDN